MAIKENNFKNALLEVLSENGRLLTIFAVSAILISGITLIRYPQNWWIAFLAVVGFFFAVFLFLNARVVVKSILSVALTVLLAGVAFNVGAQIEPSGSGAFVWLFGTFIVFFLSLALSYFLPSGQSRWTAVSFAVLVYFLLTWSFSAIFESLAISAAVSILIAVSAFVLFYLYGGASRVSFKKMPQHVHSEELTSAIERAAEHSGFELRKFSSKNETTFLVWKDRAYLLYPVQLNQAFGVIGKKKNIRLSYQGKSINSWLRWLSFMKSSSLRSRGAETMLILLDMTNANGNETKFIGVASPDSKAVLPVGIRPSKLLLSKNKSYLKKAFENLDLLSEDYITDLTEKQKASLFKIPSK